MTESTKPVLVIDASYGLTIAIAGQEPQHIADSRAHVERLVPTVDAALSQQGLRPADLGTVVVASGPGPFTGLRAGIVAARAIAFATGAKLLGHDVLSVQAAWEQRHPHAQGPRLLLAVNDARRHQLYWQLWRLDGGGSAASAPARPAPLTQMDISYPQTIAQRILEIEKAQGSILPLVVIGPGTGRYVDDWKWLADQGVPLAAQIDDSAICGDGVEGPQLFADLAFGAQERGEDVSSEPLYLRRPDAKVSPALKPVSEDAVRPAGDRGDAGVPASKRAEAPQSAREATREGRDLKWSSWSKEDLRRFATKTDPGVDDDDQPDELAAFGSSSDDDESAAAGRDGSR